MYVLGFLLASISVIFINLIDREKYFLHLAQARYNLA